MRAFEWIQVAAVAIAVFFPVATGFRLKRGRMAVVLLAAMLLQLLVEGFRWQLIPLELATVLLAVPDALREDRRVRGVLRFRRGALAPFGLAAIVALPLALPIPELPRPTGPYAVGTRSFQLLDIERDEVYGGVPEGTPRRIMAQVWYPATVEEGAEVSVWNPDWDVVGPAVAGYLGFPGFFLSHASGLPSHSYSGAPPLSGKFPVVLYSHGWKGFRTIALNQMESLASHGFVVVAADHTYGAAATRLSNGDVIAFDEAALPDEDTVGQEDYEEAATLLVETYSEDLVFLVDELEAGAEGGFGQLAGSADLDLVGAFGHSTGGGATVRFCILDKRCKAALGFDAWVLPVTDRVVARELRVPSLFVRSDGWIGTPNDRRLRGLAERSPAQSYWMALNGANHNDFVLTPVFSPVADRLGIKGPIPARRVVPVLDDILVGFFDRYLLGIGGAVLDELPPPEVTLELIP